MLVSQNRGPQYRPKNAIVSWGTTQKIPLIRETPISTLDPTPDMSWDEPPRRCPRAERALPACTSPGEGRSRRRRVSGGGGG